MVLKLCVLDGLVLESYLDKETRSSLIPGGPVFNSDEWYSNYLEGQGWQLISVVPVTNSEYHDKELWFRKD